MTRLTAHVHATCRFDQSTKPGPSNQVTNVFMPDRSRKLRCRNGLLYCSLLYVMCTIVKLLFVRVVKEIPHNRYIVQHYNRLFVRRQSSVWDYNAKPRMNVRNWVIMMAIIVIYVALQFYTFVCEISCIITGKFRHEIREKYAIAAELLL